MSQRRSKSALTQLKKLVSSDKPSPVLKEEQQFEGPNHVVARKSLKNCETYDGNEERNAGQRLLWGALLQNPVSRRCAFVPIYGLCYTLHTLFESSKHFVLKFSAWCVQEEVWLG
jgi:hypothetical protein